MEIVKCENCNKILSMCECGKFQKVKKVEM